MVRRGTSKDLANGARAGAVVSNPTKQNLGLDYLLVITINPHPHHNFLLAERLLLEFELKKALPLP